MFIVSLTYNRPLTEVDLHLEAHVAYLQAQYAKGHFIFSGRKVPRTGGVIVAKVKTRDELEAILAKDPFAIAGIAEYEITEFVASMTAADLDKLKEQ